MKKFKKGLMTAALTGALAAAMVMPAFATQEANENQIADSSEIAYLNKYVRTADGVAFPGEMDDAAYSFTFTKEGSDTVAANKHPEISGVTIKVNAGETKGSFNLSAKLADVFNGKTNPAGEYIYTVAEAKGNGPAEVTAANANTDITQKETYDPNTYTLRVYVKNDKNDPGKTILDKITVEDADKNKVDPTDDDPSNDTNDDNDGTGAKPGDTDSFTFVNIYQETIKTTPTPPDGPDNPNSGTYGAFGFSKDVEGDYGDQTKDFNFTVKLIIPEKLKDQIDATPVTAKKYSKGVQNGTVTLNYGTDGTRVTLKHGEAIGIEELPAGIKYTVTEDDYTPEKYTTTYTADNDNVTLTKENAGTNVGVKNEFENITPTGIVINNFPYILMILVAIAGIAFYETKKRARA